jgi:hypothetical protein
MTCSACWRSGGVSASTWRLLALRDRSKTLTGPASAEPVTGAQYPAVQRALIPRLNGNYGGRASACSAAILVTMPGTPRPYLLILRDADGLAYVLREHRVAFTSKRRIPLTSGDIVFLYTTRGIFGNPAAGRGLIIGRAEIISDVVRFERKLGIADRAYRSGCDLAITGLVPLGEGVELRQIVDELETFHPHPKRWAFRIYSSFLQLSSKDASVIHERTRPLLQDPEYVSQAYISRAESVRREARRRDRTKHPY